MAARRKKLVPRHRSTEATARGTMLSTGAPKDFYLEFTRADMALRGVAERDAAVQAVLREVRARIDQQLGEVEAFTRDWTERVSLLKRALVRSQDLAAELERACKVLKEAPGGR